MYINRDLKEKGLKIIFKTFTQNHNKLTTTNTLYKVLPVQEFTILELISLSDARSNEVRFLDADYFTPEVNFVEFLGILQHYQRSL